MRALVVTGGHFSDSFTLAPIERPSRGVTVFFRVWLKDGSEQRFLSLAGIDEIKPPPRVQVGMDTPPDDGRRAVARQCTTPRLGDGDGEGGV